ncbi:hypothetical protein DFH08DRAFT_385726 [Mycena albidolilacea]|uniref:Uncharacterized protein n=1 Tax=Mycena albidolilacea TaxID=1033008 RepID=A0AAD7EH81_9AGAR|nr:hypothetical protein DFH08DRAFT_385726 [Mycena albidolilacea]
MKLLPLCQLLELIRAFSSPTEPQLSFGVPGPLRPALPALPRFHFRPTPRRSLFPTRLASNPQNIISYKISSVTKRIVASAKRTQLN